MFKNTQSYSQKVIYKIGFIDIFTEPIFKIMSCSAPLKSSGEKGFQKEWTLSKPQKKEKKQTEQIPNLSPKDYLNYKTNSSGEAVIDICLKL